MIALYRPGPMDNIPQLINASTGKEKVEYLHPCLEPNLRDTYGVFVYQEDIMSRPTPSAGLPGQADICSAIGKKKKSELRAAQRKSS